MEEEIKPKLKLIGKDGNIFSILGRAQRAFKEANQIDKWDTFKKEAMSSDYNNALQVCMKYFDVE